MVAGIVPNKFMCTQMLEASMRKNDTDMIIEQLENFIAINQQPHAKVLKILAGTTNMPDELFTILDKNFVRVALLKHGLRQFEKPRFDASVKERGLVTPKFGRQKLKKKAGKKEHPGKVRSDIRLI